MGGGVWNKGGGGGGGVGKNSKIKNRGGDDYLVLKSAFKNGFNSILYFIYIWKRLWLTKPKYYKVI